ncbi:MAG TPA: DUF5681 domain-containing protein [Bacteroidales bacterium]|nr:DUF5681 domain-containing protein [Bacteroidales bacterium]
MAKFEKGKSGNPKGKKRGTCNRSTEQIRTAIQQMIDENFELIKADFKRLEPEKRTKFYIDLLKMVLPPPLTPEALTEPQLEMLLEFIQKKYTNEQDRQTGTT